MFKYSFLKYNSFKMWTSNHNYYSLDFILNENVREASSCTTSKLKFKLKRARTRCVLLRITVNYCANSLCILLVVKHSGLLEKFIVNEICHFQWVSMLYHFSKFHRTLGPIKALYYEYRQWVSYCEPNNPQARTKLSLEGVKV